MNWWNWLPVWQLRLRAQETWDALGIVVGDVWETAEALWALLRLLTS